MGVSLISFSTAAKLLPLPRKLTVGRSSNNLDHLSCPSLRFDKYAGIDFHRNCFKNFESVEARGARAPASFSSPSSSFLSSRSLSSSLVSSTKPTFVAQITQARLPNRAIFDNSTEKETQELDAAATSNMMTRLPILPTSATAALALMLLVALALPFPAEAFALSDLVSGVESAVAAAGPLGPALFIIVYAASAVVLIPGSVLTVAAGFLFGPVLGSAVVSIAATLGAAAAFLVGRYLARPLVADKIQGDARFAAVDSAIGAQGAKIVLLLRLSPLFPYTLLNYALSLTAIPFGEYVLASWVGMLPGTLAYVALGGAGKAAAETAAGVGTSPVQLVVYALGALGTLGATVLISRAASKALAEADASVGGRNDD